MAFDDIFNDTPVDVKEKSSKEKFADKIKKALDKLIKEDEGDWIETSTKSPLGVQHK